MSGVLRIASVSCLLTAVVQQFAKSAPRPADSRADGADGQVERFADFCVREPFDCKQHQRLAISFRQCEQCSGHDQRCRSCVQTLSAALVVVVGLRCTMRSEASLHRPDAPLLAAQPSPHEVGGDPVQPRAGAGCCRVEVLATLERHTEHLPREIVCAVVPQPAGHVAVDRPEVPIEDHREVLRVNSRATHHLAVRNVDPPSVHA